MILLTGASGFIGKHLLSAIIKKYGSDKVVALTSQPIEESLFLLHHNYNFNNDYFLKSGFGEIDTILHAGAFTPKSNIYANDWEKSTSNIQNTLKLLQANLPSLKRFVFLSTLDVYDSEDIIDEDSKINPLSLYGESKLYCERMLAAWSKQEGKIAQVLRVGHVYGPGEEEYQKLIPVTLKKIINGEPIQMVGDGSDIRSFIYIDDVVKALMKASELEKDIGPVNIVSDYQLNIREIVEAMIALSDTKPTIEKISSNSKPRNLLFNNAKLMANLLDKETSFEIGLKAEWDYFINMFGKRKLI